MAKVDRSPPSAPIPLSPAAPAREPEPAPIPQAELPPKATGVEAGYRGAQDLRGLERELGEAPVLARMKALGLRLPPRSVDADPDVIAAERLLSRRLRTELRAAFGEHAAALFQLPTELMKAATTGDLPPDLTGRLALMIQQLGRHKDPSGEPLPITLVNRLHADGQVLGELLARVQKEGPKPRLLYQANELLAPLLVELAQARGVYLKGTPSGDAGFYTFQALRKKEVAEVELQRQDPEAYAILARRRQTFAAFDQQAELACKRENLEPRKAKILGALITIGTDRVTGEETAFSAYHGALPLEQFIEKRREFLEDRAALESSQQEPPIEKLPRVPAEILDALPGEARFASLTDDASKSVGLTRIFKVKAHEGRDVVLEGRFAGLYLDELVNARGRMIGTGYSFEPTTGKIDAVPTRPAIAEEEPYVTVAYKRERGVTKEKLFVQLPFKQGEWTEVRQALRKLTVRIPSIQYLEGSKNTSFYFDPKDFAIVRETLQQLTLSKGALEVVRGYFQELAAAEQATAAENLDVYRAQLLGGFKKNLRGPGGVRPVELSFKQKAALAWLEANGTRGVCSLDTGEGKTLTSIALMQKMLRDGAAEDPGGGKFLFVCPRSLQGNLAKEIHRFLEPAAAAELLSRVEVLSYGEFRAATKAGRHEGRPFRPQKYSAVFFDEAQALKNPNNEVSKAALAFDHPHKICLTASPMEKNPMEAYALSCVANNIDLAHRDHGKQFRREMRKFKERFCETFGGRIVGVKADPLTQRDLHTWVKRNVFYTDKRIGSELPELLTQNLTVKMDPRVETEYRKVAKELGKAMSGLVSLFGNKGRDAEGHVDPHARDPKVARTLGIGLADTLKQLYLLANRPEKLFKGLGFPKIDAASAVIKERLAASQGASRAVLFADDREMVLDSARELSKQLPGKFHAACLNNEIHVFKNGRAVPKFHGHEVPFTARPYRNDLDRSPNKTDNRHYRAAQWQQFVLGEVLSPNLDVATVSMVGQTYQTGQNLQAFDTCIHLDRDTWCSEDMRQRTARLWRQGQDSPVLELTIDSVYANPKNELDQTLEQIRKLHQELEGTIFDMIIKAAQTTELGQEWFEMKSKQASFLKLDQDTLELMASPMLARARPRGEAVHAAA